MFLLLFLLFPVYSSLPYSVHRLPQPSSSFLVHPFLHVRIHAGKVREEIQLQWRTWFYRDIAFPFPSLAGSMLHGPPVYLPVHPLLQPSSSFLWDCTDRLEPAFNNTFLPFLPFSLTSLPFILTWHRSDLLMNFVSPSLLFISLLCATAFFQTRIQAFIHSFHSFFLFIHSFIPFIHSFLPNPSPPIHPILQPSLPFLFIHSFYVNLTVSGCCGIDCIHAGKVREERGRESATW